MGNKIEGAHTCFICKDKFSWKVTLPATKNHEDQVEVYIASTFYTVEGIKADLEIYAKCPSCQTKYKFESSCPIEMVREYELV
ncbi:MAG TPA: hypothetical protein VJ824_15735 [Bacillota bacterium]|nr:hypothetical protein [Bacillota bacterium]